MLAPPERFTTPRLLVRRSRPDDAEAIFEAYASDPQVTRYVLFLPAERVEETRAYLEENDRAWHAGERFAYALNQRHDADRPIGMIDARLDGTASPIKTPNTVWFGYILAPAHWGRGLVAEAMAVLVDWFLAQPEIWRAASNCYAGHHASRRVMEKAGLACEGVMRRAMLLPNLSPEPVDVALYARTRDDRRRSSMAPAFP